MTLEEYRFSLTILSALNRAPMQRLHKFAVGGRIFQIHFFQIVVHHLFLNVIFYRYFCKRYYFMNRDSIFLKVWIKSIRIAECLNKYEYHLIIIRIEDNLTNIFFF